jgi:hypothetical protein
MEGSGLLDWLVLEDRSMSSLQSQARAPLGYGYSMFPALYCIRKTYAERLTIMATHTAVDPYATATQHFALLKRLIQAEHPTACTCDTCALNTLLAITKAAPGTVLQHTPQLCTQAYATDAALSIVAQIMPDRV